MSNLMPIESDSYSPCEKAMRRVLCTHYSTCLDYAVEKNWQGFSCERCENYERLQLNEEEWREDYSRCLTLLSFVRSSKLRLKVNGMNSTVRERTSSRRYV